MFDLFKRKPIAKASQLSAVAAKNEPKPLSRPARMTDADEKRVYAHNPSIVDYLPWAEFLDEEQCLLLDDGVSVGAVYDVTPVATEGRSDQRLEQIRDVVESALQDSFDDLEANPWIVQFFCQDENNLDSYLDGLRGYVKPHAQGSLFTEEWLKQTELHLRGIARPQGLFTDKVITGQPWRGQQRRTRMVVYRWTEKNSGELMSPIGMLNQVCDRICSSLSSVNITCVRQNGLQVHSWLLRLFNPAPAGLDKEQFYRAAAYEDSRNTPEGMMPVENDFAETLLFTPPHSDVENGVWWLDNIAHSAMSVERLRKPPQPGTITGEKSRGEKQINALMDMFPEGTMLCMTVIAEPQDTLEEKFNRLAKNAIGENSESGRVRQDVKAVKELLGTRHKLYRAAITFFLRAADMNEMNRKRIELTTVLLNEGLQPVRAEHETGPLNTWLRALPMCFNPKQDKNNWYTRLTWVQHIAGLLPVTGRETGTGNPGFSFFNRGGDVLNFDPLNKNDRSQNAHMLLFGPTGAGKSATLCSMLCQLMAVHRPRLFIAEAGNSFGLTADYFESQGLTVNKVSVKPGSGVTLPLFADAHKLFDVDAPAHAINENDLPDIDDDPDDEVDEKRDILGEMEISARMMITGGDQKEDAALKRADRAMIREALVMAARKTLDENRQMLPSDLQEALYKISQETENDSGQIRNESRRAKAAEMAESLGMFTQHGSFEAELFNQEGSLWPEVDVTLIDLAHLAREGYEAQMALTMVSLTNTINNIAERDQYSERDIVFTVDEAHVVTVNPLLAPYMTKVVKMWRKLGAWLWLATQNLEDYPNAAGKMLNMAEWWICLTMPKKEVEDIARFRTLSDEQKNVLLSARKLSGCYTEGVVLAKEIEALFRAVPPSLFLALGMTEKEEKAERKALMRKHNCSELDAAILVARKLDRLRGLLTEDAAGMPKHNDKREMLTA